MIWGKTFMIRINRIWGLLFFCLVISLICSGKLWAKDPALFPKLVVDSKTHYMGEVMRGEIISHTFLIRNTGKGNLRIKKAQRD